MIKTQHLPTGSFTPNEANPRDMKNPKELQVLKDSIQRNPDFFEVRPILATPDRKIFAGHMRWRAAVELGFPTVPAALMDIPEDRQRELMLLDNRQNGVWNMDRLANMGEDLLIKVGFGDELGKIIKGDHGQDDELNMERAAAIARANPVTKLGDVIVMKDHRLICGDSTDPAVMEKLMAGRRADCIWTDPPYGVSYTDKNDFLNNARKGTGHKAIAGDELRGSKLQDMLTAAFSNMANHTGAGGCIYVAHADANSQQFRDALQQAGYYISQTIIWVKNAAVLSRNDYNWQHEPILYGWKDNGPHFFSKDFGSTTVIDQEQDLTKATKEQLLAMCRAYRELLPSTVIKVDRPTKADLHPTMKPVTLIGKMIFNSTRVGGLVLDPFLGSGSTMIAAEQLGRICYGIELDPTYCDIIVARWEQLTGLKAQREIDTCQKAKPKPQTTKKKSAGAIGKNTKR